MITIIPALNEEQTISKVVGKVKKYVDEIILVDDASTDETASIAQQEGATVFYNKRNQGYDKSINNGFSLAEKRGVECIQNNRAVANLSWSR